MIFLLSFFIFLPLVFAPSSPMCPKPQHPTTLTSGPMALYFQFSAPSPTMRPSDPNPREVALVESHTKAQ